MSGAALALEGVSLRLGGFQLRDISFALAMGEIFVLLGPSGAGKSVLLETIAGFNRPDRGRILMGERDITRAAPESRRIGFMFQDYALFPHLTVAQNIAFGAHGRHGGDRGRLRSMQARLGLEAVAGRRPGRLSGGERQRVALARALASEPELFLFDEPLSALDANTRDTLRDELKDLLREVGIPAIYVTHDQTEALVLADRLAVIRNGELAQVGTPTEVFDAPADRFVATFVGVENILEGRVLRCANGRTELQLEPGPVLAAAQAGFPEGTRVLACVRPEDLAVASGDLAETAAWNHWQALVTAVEPCGPVLRIRLDCGVPLSAYLTRQAFLAQGIRPGLPVRVSVRAEAVHLMAPGKSLCAPVKDAAPVC